MQFLKNEYSIPERMSGFKKLQDTISIASKTNSKFLLEDCLAMKAVFVVYT